MYSLVGQNGNNADGRLKGGDGDTNESMIVCGNNVAKEEDDNSAKKRERSQR